jgi:predicted N-acetyltransferase YhbS
MNLDYLGNHPELAEQLAKFSWTEWRDIYEARGDTFADAKRNYRERTNIDALPLALVALADEQLIGTVSLKHADLELRPELSPWLGGLCVVPEWRRRGVASLLVQRAVEEAARIGLPKLFLWTSSAEALYQKLEWCVVERVRYCGKWIVIMDREP